MAAKPNVTLDEFLVMEETKPYSEFANGVVFQKSGGDWPHAAVQVFFISALFEFQQRANLGQALPELLCIFGRQGNERAYVPDIVYVAKERMTTDLYLRVAPDLAIEILSPDEDRARLVDKVQFYLLNGVRLVWAIAPDAQAIAVLAAGQEGKTLYAGDTLDGDDVLPGFSVVVDEIFAKCR